MEAGGESGARAQAVGRSHRPQPLDNRSARHMSLRAGSPPCSFVTALCVEMSL